MGLRPFARAALLLLAALPALAESPQPAVIARLAPRSLLLDVAALPGGAIVAVGERGHVLVSHDGGQSFTQSPAPARSGLTAVAFADREHGWAVGHDEVILRTSDGGASWQLAHYAPEKQQPLLGVWFGDASHGIAIGAFATVYTTADGGQSWQLSDFTPRPLHAAAPKAHKGRITAADLAESDDEGLAQPHLNAIARAGSGRLYIAGEAGHIFASDDGGHGWVQLAAPYDGSLFGILPLDGDALLVFGLRGHLYRSDDAGKSWRALESHSEALLSGSTRLGDGTVVIVGLSGTVLVSSDGGLSFSAHQQADRKGLSAVAPAPGGVVVVGEAGVHLLSRAALGLGG
jgi:photosystem II stability/assembly factor-like uncharacterized protein